MHESGTLRPSVTVATIVERDGRFLVVEEETRNGTELNQPAGHLEAGETLPAAAIRETLEETGWHVTPTALVGVYRWHCMRPCDDAAKGWAMANQGYMAGTITIERA